MEFDFASSSDKDLFISLKGLINKNSGFFRTAKQAQFLFKQYTETNIHTPDEAMRFFGVPLVDGQVLVTVTAHTRWADYGSRSIIPIIYAFVVDQFGVVAHYKVSGRGNLRDGWGPDPTKTKMVWVRSDDAVCPWSFPTEQEIAEQKASIPESNWLGVPGDKVEAELKFLRCISLGVSQFGPMYLSNFVDRSGNVVNIWKYFELTQNDIIKVKGTIKATDFYKGTKQTTLIRVKAI